MKQILNIDPTTAISIWRQIEEGVRQLVASGRLEPGAAVPSVRELSRNLRVNPATVSKAYQRLTNAGLLETRRGEGTFVAELDDERLVSERQRQLTEGADAFFNLARGLGASRKEALETLHHIWDQPNEGGREDET